MPTQTSEKLYIINYIQLSKVYTFDTETKLYNKQNQMQNISIFIILFFLISILA